MIKVGFIGYRSLVGTVMIQRMLETDFQELEFEPFFFSTSEKEKPSPSHFGSTDSLVIDSFSETDLKKCDILVSCQGGNYTKSIHPELRQQGWQGIWLDSASALRLKKDSTIVLDPLNRPLIEDRLSQGKKDFIGANCTTSLLLMALQGLFEKKLVKAISGSTYQAASGAGSKHIIELLQQIYFLAQKTGVNPYPAEEKKRNKNSALELESLATKALKNEKFPREYFKVPLAGNLIPWIDEENPNFPGSSEEELKPTRETQRILNYSRQIPIITTCIRVGTLRCHFQALCVRLKQNLPLDEIEEIIHWGNQWVEIIPNNKEESITRLTPAAISGSLTIVVGRIRKPDLDGTGKDLLVYTGGDQLLWGAAEPLHRALRIILEQKMS